MIDKFDTSLEYEDDRDVAWSYCAASWPEPFDGDDLDFNLNPDHEIGYFA